MSQDPLLEEKTYISDMTGPIMIRPFEARDIPEMVQVYNQYMTYYHEQKQMTIEQMQEYLAEPGEEIPEHTYVAVAQGNGNKEEGAQLLGYISLCLVKGEQRLDVFTYSAIKPWWIEAVGLALFSYAEMELVRERSRRFADLGEEVWHWLVPGKHLEMRELAHRLSFEVGDEVIQLQKEIDTSVQLKKSFLPEGYRFVAGDNIEAEQWAKLTNEAFSWSPSSHTTAAAVMHTRSSTSFNPDYHIGIVDSSDQLIGLIEGEEVLQDNRECYGFIATVAVATSEQGKGLGRYLIEELLNRFAQFGMTKVKLSLNTENPTPARELYQRLGFSEYAGVSRYKKLIHSA